MFDSIVLDVALGLALVYLLLAFVVSSIREAIAAVYKTRASFLWNGVRDLLHGEALTKALYEHPLVNSLYTGSYDDVRQSHMMKPTATFKLPSYIPSNNFALALLDIVLRGKDPKAPLQAGPEAPVMSPTTLRQQVTRLGNPEVQRVLLAAIDTAHGDLAKVQANVAAWFDSAMDRVSGRYKRRSQGVLFVVGFLVTVIADVDTVRVAHFLYRDPGRRDAAVAMASTVTQGGGLPDALARLDSLRLPIAWADVSLGDAGAVGSHVLNSLVGWLLTAFAISLGAPFWFDILGKVSVIRATVKPKEKSPEEGSEDRQPAKGIAAAAGVLGATTPSAPAAPNVSVVVSNGGGGPGDPAYSPQEWATGHAQGGVL